MKRFLSLTIAVVLLLSMCFSLITVNAEETGLKPLPQVGDVISGFKTVEIGNMDLINSKTVLFEHEKTGALLYFIQSKDIDRAFELTFKTPAVDDTGVNHIIEHLTVSGSNKYPLKDVLFTLANQTYSSFVNAFTYPSLTSYPVSSMSEAQLLKLADVYMDCAYNPSVYTNKNLFLREGWRYNLESEDGPLSINGIVYNEMKGALGNISSAAAENVNDALFPNSILSNNSGGVPDKISSLTYEQLINTHKKYYHPSNSLMVLYGNVDYTKFLKLINDNYLSHYDKKDIVIDDGKTAPFAQKVEKTFKFPVAANSNTKNSAQIDYAFALKDVSEEDIIGLSILAEVLNQESSPLKQAFSKKQIGGNLSVSFNNAIPQAVLTFTVQNADEQKALEFKALVDDCISAMVKDGYDKESVNAIISATLLSNSNFTEMSNLGINLATSVSLMWANYNSINYLSNVLTNIKSISQKVDKKYMEDLTSMYIQNNNHAALVTTIPEAGLAEKQAAQQEKALAEMKASLDKQDIQKMISDTNSFNEWNKKSEGEAELSVIKELQAVNVSDLPVEVKDYNIKETSLNDGVRILTANADVGETGSTMIVMDTSAVPVDKLQYLNLFSSLLGQLDTDLYAKAELNTLKIKYLNGASFALSTIPTKDWSKFTPCILISWAGLMDEYDNQLSLVKEMLLNTKFTDIDTISYIVKQQITLLKNQFVNNPVNLLINRNLSVTNDCINYSSYLSGLDYYDFLTQLEQKIQSDPNSVTAELQSVKDLVLNRTNMITSFAGNKKGIEEFESTIKPFISTLPAKPITVQDYSKLPKPALNEAIALDTSVQYNMISATYDDMGVKDNGKYIPIGLFIADNYITPKIRLEYGAYDNIVNFGGTAFMLVSYRDPNIKETFEVYAELPEFIKNTNITQEELDRYILKAFGASTATAGELGGATNAISQYLMGRTTEDRLQLLREIKSTTVQDVKAMGAVFENLLKNGTRSTVGNPNKIAENKDLYNSIISFGQSQVNETLTRAQLMEMLVQGVPNPVEYAKQANLLQGDGKGNYAENEKLTKEQLAIFINRVAQMYGLQLSPNDTAITDIKNISPWAMDSVKALISSGIAQLDPEGKFNPKAEVTIADVQAYLNGLSVKLSGN